MKKTLILILLLVSWVNSYSQTPNTLTIGEKVFTEELKSFIDTVRPNSIRKGKYNVFVVNIYHIESNKHFCFTLGYIDNEFELEYITTEYVFYSNEEIILVRAHTKKIKSIFKNIAIKKIENQDKLRIIEKLYPSSKGGMTGIYEGAICCYEKGKIERTFYKNSDLIPREKSIWSKTLTGGTIEKIR